MANQPESFQGRPVLLSTFSLTVLYQALKCGPVDGIRQKDNRLEAAIDNNEPRKMGVGDRKRHAHGVSVPQL